MQSGYKTSINLAVHRKTLYIRCALFSYVLLRSTNQADFIRLKSFELHKTFWTDELSAVYDVSLQHIRATNGLCPLPLDKRLRYSLGLFSTHIRCLWKRREGGKIRCTERLNIVNSPDIERCKRLSWSWSQEAQSLQMLLKKQFKSSIWTLAESLNFYFRFKMWSGGT